MHDQFNSGDQLVGNNKTDYGEKLFEKVYLQSNGVRLFPYRGWAPVRPPLFHPSILPWLPLSVNSMSDYFSLSIFSQR